MAIPEGAQLSDDGQWWWDETNQQWQSVADGSNQSQGTYQISLGLPQVNGGGIQWDVSNVGNGEAPVGTPAGRLGFEFYPEDGGHSEVASHDAQLREVLPAYQTGNIGVLASEFVNVNGHYQAYLSSGSDAIGQVSFEYVDGQVTES